MVVRRRISSSSSSSFELSAFSSDSGSSMRALLTRIKSEVTFGLSVPRSSKEKHIGAGGGNLCQLVKGQGLSSSLVDSGSGWVGEFQSNNSQTSGNSGKSHIIGYSANNGNNSGCESIQLTFSLFVGVSGEELGNHVDNFTQTWRWTFLLWDQFILG